MATLALADPPTDLQKQTDGLQKAYASWKAQCTGVKSDWCTQEKARIDAWQKALNQQYPNSQGDQDNQ